MSNNNKGLPPRPPTPTIPKQSNGPMFNTIARTKSNTLSSTHAPPPQHLPKPKTTPTFIQSATSIRAQSHARVSLEKSDPLSSSSYSTPPSPTATSRSTDKPMDRRNSAIGTLTLTNNIENEPLDLNADHSRALSNSDSDSEAGDPSNNPSLYKTELCRSFAETGYCRYGLKCRFAHGSTDLRPVIRHKKYKTERCKNFEKTGYCPYGHRCRFIHNDQDDQDDTVSIDSHANSVLTSLNNPVATPVDSRANSMSQSTSLKPIPVNMYQSTLPGTPVVHTLNAPSPGFGYYNLSNMSNHSSPSISSQANMVNDFQHLNLGESSVGIFQSRVIPGSPSLSSMSFFSNMNGSSHNMGGSCHNMNHHMNMGVDVCQSSNHSNMNTGNINMNGMNVNMGSNVSHMSGMSGMGGLNLGMSNNISMNGSMNGSMTGSMNMGGMNNNMNMNNMNGNMNVNGNMHMNGLGGGMGSMGGLHGLNGSMNGSMCSSLNGSSHMGQSGTPNHNQSNNNTSYSNTNNYHPHNTSYNPHNASSNMPFPSFSGRQPSFNNMPPSSSAAKPPLPISLGSRPPPSPTLPQMTNFNDPFSVPHSPALSAHSMGGMRESMSGLNMSTSSSVNNTNMLPFPNSISRVSSNLNSNLMNTSGHNMETGSYHNEFFGIGSSTAHSSPMLRDSINDSTRLSSYNLSTELFSTNVDTPDEKVLSLYNNEAT